MVRHVILWQLKDELSAEEKCAAKKAIKEGLEALKGVVPEIVEINVHVNGLESSNADIMLDSVFENEEGLKAYAVNPNHVAVAKGTVVPAVKQRVCIDFEF